MTLVKKILALMRYKLWFKGLLNGIPATIELEKLLKDIKVPETIIDIGSNKGQFILLMEELFPNKMVYSFEPIIEMLNRQKRRLKQHLRILSSRYSGRFRKGRRKRLQRRQQRSQVSTVTRIKSVSSKSQGL